MVIRLEQGLCKRRHPNGQAYEKVLTWVSYCCPNSKFPQTWWLKTTQMYYLTVLEVWSSQWASLGKNWDTLSAVFFLEALAKNSFQLCRGCPPSLASGPLPSSKPTTAIQGLSHYMAASNMTLPSHTLLPPSFTCKDFMIALGPWDNPEQAPQFKIEL